VGREKHFRGKPNGVREAPGYSIFTEADLLIIGPAAGKTRGYNFLGGDKGP
jgi:hypothetical protein